MSVAEGRTVFALGATGYIGGSVLSGIVHEFKDVQVAALVRNPNDDKAVLEAFGKTLDDGGRSTNGQTGRARIVRGSFEHLDVIEQESLKADVVLNCADADNLDLVKAILKGLKRRWDQGGVRKPVLIHTSGTGVIITGGDGSFVDSPIIDDSKVEDIEGIGKDQIHRVVDLTIFQANTDGYVDAYIVAPSAVYGNGTGPVRKLTAQIPELVRVAIKRQQAVHVGKGTSVWNHVHIKDLEQLYVVVAKLAFSGKDDAPSFGRFYFGSGEMHAWGDVVKAIAPILKARGKIPTDDVGSVTLEEEKGVAGFLWTTATNSRSRPGRGLALGWSPRKEGLWDSLEEVIDMTISEFGL